MQNSLTEYLLIRFSIKEYPISIEILEQAIKINR